MGAARRAGDLPEVPEVKAYLHAGLICAECGAELYVLGRARTAKHFTYPDRPCKFDEKLFLTPSFECEEIGPPPEPRPPEKWCAMSLTDNAKSAGFWLCIAVVALARLWWEYA